MQYKNSKREASQRKVFRGKLVGAIVGSLLAVSVLATAVLANNNLANFPKASVPTTSQLSFNNSPEEFHPIEQPPILKVGITLGSLTFIGLELWWFLGSKPKFM